MWHIFSSDDCRKEFLDSSFKTELQCKKKSPSFKAENSLFLHWLGNSIFCSQSNFCCTVLSCIALTAFLLYKHQRWVEVKVHLLQTKMQILHSLVWQILPGRYIDQIGAKNLCSQPLAQSALGWRQLLSRIKKTPGRTTLQLQRYSPIPKFPNLVMDAQCLQTALIFVCALAKKYENSKFVSLLTNSQL